MRQFAFPYRPNSSGRTADATLEEHVKQLIEQVIFTSPGERVNRPEFGSGLLQMAFAPAGDEMATATQYLVQGALQQWLDEAIKVEAVDVRASDGALTVSVQYVIRRNQERHVAQYSREL
ncbi:MAG: GPW/gp25 family protein [Alphaproteobacteria bacterium]|nr:GPW/gp25 family protein [Alphaproteobacteria bacterium]